LKYFYLYAVTMKKVIELITVTAILLTSCTREITINQNNAINNLTTITGDFLISKYTNTTEDSAKEFDGYVFSFAVDGRITAVKNNDVMFGSYVETPSYEGQSARLGLYFSNRPLSALNKNYYINSISDAAIQLSDVASPGQVLEFTAQ